MLTPPAGNVRWTVTLNRASAPPAHTLPGAKEPRARRTLPAAVADRICAAFRRLGASQFKEGLLARRIEGEWATRAGDIRYRWRFMNPATPRGDGPIDAAAKPAPRFVT